MKRVFSTGIITILILGIIGLGYIYIKKKQTRKYEYINIELKNDKTTGFSKISPLVNIPISEKKLMILKGVLKWEEQEIAPNVQPIRNVVIVTDIGKTYVLSGPAAYVNTLIFNAIGKEVKLKVLITGKTSFKDYDGLWIDDILEIKK